jgi:large subunit ribosomal protein L18
MKTNRKLARTFRHGRVRAKVSGTAVKPRMNVFRSLSHIYIQLIDDQAGKTLAAVSTKELKGKGKKSDLATEAGKKAAEKALALGIKEVVFDRGGYLYHGRIKACAEGARAGGLKF